MIYKDYEIYARVYVEGSDLWELDEKGKPQYSLDIFTPNEENNTILWYEVAMFEGEQFQSIEEAKKHIDKWVKENS